MGSSSAEAKRGAALKSSVTSALPLEGTVTTLGIRMRVFGAVFCPH
jgi:hypothetical protein